MYSSLKWLGYFTQVTSVAGLRYFSWNMTSVLAFLLRRTVLFDLPWNYFLPVQCPTNRANTPTESWSLWWFVINRHRRGHGFKSLTGLNFSGPIHTTAQLRFIYVKIAFIFIYQLFFPLSLVILLSLLPGPKLKVVHIFHVFDVYSTGGFAILTLPHFTGLFSERFQEV